MGRPEYAPGLVIDVMRVGPAGDLVGRQRISIATDDDELADEAAADAIAAAQTARERVSQAEG